MIEVVGHKYQERVTWIRVRDYFANTAHTSKTRRAGRVIH